MTSLRHIMIMASAGSGKTYALTDRFVQLLAAGAAPERIVALTFTRKAAGEFFDEILRKLARAARDPDAAHRLAANIGQPQLGSADFLRLLRAMVDAMHRLRLGTLDSFFARVARAFPLELGLAGEFEILHEHAARLERERVLRLMFARRGGAPNAAQQEFIEAFKRATFGTEEKRLGARLDAFLDEHHENYLAAPEAACWGEPSRIWPNGASWFDPDTRLGEAVRELRESLDALTDGQRARWEAFFVALETWTPGATIEGPIEYILNNALKVWRELGDGGAEMTVERRKLALSKRSCAALRRVVTHVIGAELRRHLETTRGIHAVLQAYDANYHASVRRAGRLTFSDVQRLLLPVRLAGGVATVAENAPATDEAASQLELFGTAAEAAAERRLMLDYRLDAEIDHWLLDEFQDTSFGQWSVLRNLVDEVVQDPEGRRTFFCVGDVKQAIYAWREGDPRLFREIFNHYNRATDGAIEERHLVSSWRSGPSLVEMVNTVFGQPQVLNELFPGPASAAWNREWKAHVSAVPNRVGQAALLHAEDEVQRWETVGRLLQELRPLERGLTCAVLVKKNDTAAAIADLLRRQHIPALAESDLHVAIDNPLGAALLALVQAAAHPEDTLAREHVAMTPLAAVLAERGLVTPEAVTRAILRGIHEDGFERAMSGWIERLEPKLRPDDVFSRQRAREFVAAAGLFDATGSRDLDEFIAYMERHAVRAPESPAVVRVMTVHKSKGLGFDVVIVPDLQGNRIDERRDGLAVQKAADRSVEWILALPPKLFHSQDEVLSAHVRAAEADACYENLSLLYVALTRAKSGLYVITEPVGQSKSRNFPRLLAATLGEETGEIRVGAGSFAGAWSAGDPDWAARMAVPPPQDEPAPAELPPVPAPAARAARRVARQPSASSGTVTGARLFSLEATTAKAFGNEVHRLLAEVGWLADSDLGTWEARWSKSGASREAVATALRCLAADELAEVWRRPGTGAEVWRERSFEVVLDEEWVTGVFDRVVVERGGDSRVSRATVFDFKTDRIVPGTTPNAARYAEQLRLYRRVAAVLLALPVDEVAGVVVFTAAARLGRIG